MANNFEVLKKYIENSKSEMVALENILTSHPALSPENGGDGELEKVVALTAWLEGQGFGSEGGSTIERFDAPDSRVSSGVRPSLVVTVPGKHNDYAVWIMAHTDVVPTGKIEAWESDPWKVVERDGKIYGRGVEDNQQGLVSAAFAALAFIKNKITPEHTIKLLFVADEECGSNYGAKYLLEKHKDLFGKDDLILIPDGGDSKGESIEIAEKNILWIRFKILGKQTHGSMPDDGINACLASADLTMRVHALEKIFDKRDSLFSPDRSTFEPTMRLANVEGINIIPGEETICFDCRVLPCYTIADALKEVRRCCDETEKAYNVKITFETPQAEESYATPSDAPIVKKLSTALKATRGFEPKLIGIGGGTVAAFFRNIGIPAVVWSTLDEMAHQVNEYAKIENIVADAVTIACLVES